MNLKKKWRNKKEDKDCIKLKKQKKFNTTMTNKRIMANEARKIMNEAKARELAKCSTCFCFKWCDGIEGDCCDEFEHLLAMAQWKDEQIKELVVGIIRNLERGEPII